MRKRARPTASRTHARSMLIDQRARCVRTCIFLAGGFRSSDGDACPCFQQHRAVGLWHAYAHNDSSDLKTNLLVPAPLLFARGPTSALEACPKGQIILWSKRTHRALVAHLYKSKLKRLFSKIMFGKREESAKILLASGDSSFLPIQFPRCSPSAPLFFLVTSPLFF